MIEITLPDGVQTYDAPVRGFEITAHLGDATVNKALAIPIEGVLRDLGDLIDQDAFVEIITNDHPEALELLRHEAALVMAEAVRELYADTQVSIGTTIENGVNSDFARETPFHAGQSPTNRMTHAGNYRAKRAHRA